MNIRKLIVLSASLTLPIWTATASEAKPSEPKTSDTWQEEVTERLAKQLDLSQKQLEQIKPILSKHSEGYRAEHEQFIEKIKANSKKLDSEIAPILTPEQKKKFETIEAEHPGAFWKLHHARSFLGEKECKMDNCKTDRCEHCCEYLCKELSLTEEQKAKIKNILEATRPQVEKIREEQTLSREQKKEKIHALFQNDREKIKSVLTPEQQAKFEKMHCDSEKCY